MALACVGQARAQATFTEVAAQAGVADGLGLAWDLAWGDCDGDGWLDVYLTNNGHLEATMTPEGDVVTGAHVALPDRLYRNNGDGTFTDRAAPAGITRPARRWSDFGAWGDYDNDGDADLYVTGQDTAGNSVCRLYRNTGDGAFVEVAAGAGVAGGGSRLALPLWADFDGDGWLDLYVQAYYGTDSEGNPVVSDSSASRLYRNRRDGTFEDLAAIAGVSGPSRHVAAADYDDDGDLDLYKVSYAPNEPTPTQLWRNNGDGTFTDVTAISGAGETPGVGCNSAA
ncbi:MAG: VCBS repeat-containing protein [Candidatus Latescibacterota bacterium]